MGLDNTVDFTSEEFNLIIEKKDTQKVNKEFEKRLKAYYLGFLNSKINPSNDEKTNKILNKAVDSLSKEGLVEMCSKIQNDEGKMQVKDTVSELVEAFREEDLDNTIDEEINGNFYEYDKSFDINAHREMLFAIGEETKGNKWRLELDEEGKVVLCE